MSVDYGKMQEVFLAAVERHQPDQWDAYLDEACAGDEELRGQVAMLLKAHAQEGSLPGRAALGMDRTGAYQPLSECPGTAIGPYKLVEQIGEGGMGTVWMAQQTEPVKRLVALKVIKPGMDSRQVIARFEAERQALALMDHPNIARVFDAGTTESGRPYFVMELVKGVPLTKYCDERRLTPKERLELFIPVCQAIQHAHQKGIIHRDIKPSNVLVALYDGKPVPKVIDFGIAKATGQQLTERTLITGFGAVVGTLEYMSPEQAELNQLDIDTRSDIYSLGVLLYELLTGSTPLERKRLKEAAMLEVLRIIREEEPPRPSTRLSTTEELPSVAANRGLEPRKLTGLVRGELDWIVMKALEKDRDRRYETANGLAMDVQRYLSDEPVEAGPPSASYRLGKFVKRNRGPVLAGSLVVLALLGGIIGTTLGMLRARSAKEAESERAEGERWAKQQALERESETKAVLDFVEHKVFAAARPKDQDGGLGYEVKLADAIKAALPFVDRSFSGHPLIEARLRMTMGVSFDYLRDAKRATEQNEKARALYTEHRGPDDPQTLLSMLRLANAYANAGRTLEALKLREETYQLMKAKLGPDDPNTLASMGSLANSYLVAGRTEEAIKLFEETLQIQKAKLGPDQYDTLRTMNNLAESYRMAGRPQEAIKLHEKTLKLRKATLGPDHPETIMSMNNLAESCADAGRYEEAPKLREETLRLRKANLGPDHPETITSMNSVADCYIGLRETDKAMAVLQETLSLREKRVKADPGNTVDQSLLAWTHGQIGETEQGRLEYAAALKAYARSVEIYEKVDQAGRLKDTWSRRQLSFYRQRLALCRKAEQAVKDLDFVLQQPSAEVPELLDMRVRFLLNEQTLPAAVESAAKMKELAGDKADQLYGAACIYSLCAAAGASKTQPRPPGAPDSEKLAEEAMALLKQAVARGFNNLAHIKADRDLYALRQRKDLQKLIADLEAKEKETGKK